MISFCGRIAKIESKNEMKEFPLAMSSVDSLFWSSRLFILRIQSKKIASAPGVSRSFARQALNFFKIFQDNLWNFRCLFQSIVLEY
ncbi:MAG: hypothetical protein Ct9H90mP7_5220 [Candidatus Neomarinimicrobiota bacterium]|nr:MAG: hypothetical protein Ct9H90mP7_5220 [Candidatus Neomarinimicrobiota bacterium]